MSILTGLQDLLKITTGNSIIDSLITITIIPM